MDTSFKDEVTAAELVPVNHSEFAKYTMREFIPNFIDGLKLVYRRVLWTLGSSSGKQKCAKLIADTMGELHPHGDASIYSGLIRLCQPFSQCLSFINPLGNCGSYGGARAAAPRYLDLERSPFACDLFFNGVNTKTFSYVPNELNTGVEPASFIPVIPTALIVGANSIGVGFKSAIPFYNFVGVCNLAIKYIQCRKDMLFHPKDFYSEFATFMIPDFPSWSLLRNTDDILENYSKGNFDAPIVTDGCMDVFPGKILLKSIPYGNAFQQILVKLKEEMTKPSFISANVNEVANLMAAVDVGDIKISLKRGVDVFEILDELKRCLGFTRSFTPIWNFSDNGGTVYRLTPYQLIEKWYVERYRSILGDLKITQRELNTQKREIEAKVIVVDNTDDVTNIVKTSASKDEAIRRLVTRFKEQKLSQLQAEYILTLSLSQLTKEGKDKLVQDLETVNKKIAEHTAKFSDVDKLVIDAIINVKDKYASKIHRRCLLPDFYGCIHINGNGIIQIRSLQELAHQVRRWGNENISIEVYPSGRIHHVKYLDAKGFTEDKLCFPKAFKAHDFKTTKNTPTCTIVLNDGLIYRVDSMIRPTKGQFIAADTKFSAITAKRTLEIHRVTDVPKRLQANALGVQTEIKFISPTVSDILAVAYYDSKEQNLIHIALVKDGERIPLSVLSKPVVAGIFRPKDPMAITIDDKYLNRCNVKHLFFSSVESLMGKETHIIVYLNRKTTSNGLNLTQIYKSIDLYGVMHINKTKDVYEFV